MAATDASVNLVAAALQYAAREWAVFPLHSATKSGCTCHNEKCESVGKHPRTRKGFYEATTDEQRIRSWWRTWPDANIGIATGPRSSFWALDVDAGGEETLEVLQHELGPLPATVEARTGSGGRHILFQYTEDVGNTIKKIGAGLDTRGDGGYIVAAPSIHGSGKPYAWIHQHGPADLPIAAAPEWLLERLREPPPRPPPSGRNDGHAIRYARGALESAAQNVRSAAIGTRNKTLNDEAFAMFGFVASGLLASGEVESVLTDAAEACGLPPREIAATIQSARAGERSPRQAPEREQPPPPAPSARIEVEEKEGPPGRPVSELLAEDIPQPKWIVPGRLLEKSIALIAGPPGAGKTFLAYDWSAQAVAAGASVYLCQNEGGKKAMQTRLARACAAAGIDNPPLRFRYDRNTTLPLADRKSVERFAKRLVGYDLIVMDSMASLWAGLDESDSGQMGMVAENMKILCEYSGATPTGIHHTIKSSWKPGEAPTLADIRGHSAMHGRIDTAFILKPLKRMAGVVRFELHTVKQRDEEEQPPAEMEIAMTGPAATVTLVQPSGPALSPAEQRLISLEPAVLALIPEPPDEPTTREKLQDALGKRGSDVRAVVARLIDRGRVKELSRKRLIRVPAPRNERYSE